MHSGLKQELDRYFSVFRSHTTDSLHRLLPPDPAVLRYQAELESEVAQLHAAIMSRLDRELSG